MLAAMSAVATPAQAFGRAGCFVAPFAHRSIPKLIGAFDEALAVQKHPEDRACDYYGRGLLYHFEGDYGRAIADYTSALGWMSNDGDAYAARGDAYEDLHQQDNAARDHALAAQYANRSAEELTERCWIRALRGRPLPPALAECNASLKLRPDDADTLVSRGLVYFRMGDYPAAIADCDAALKQKPKTASALFIRALARLRAGDSKGGNADLAAANGVTDKIAETFAIYGLKP